ncbi:hypothetical protein V6N13_044653 [Hibiscus sabdariffa]
MIKRCTFGMPVPGSRQISPPIFPSYYKLSIRNYMVMEYPSLSHLRNPRSLPTPVMGTWRCSIRTKTPTPSSNNVVAVEFDSHKNEWDPDDNHVGININSIVSVTNVIWNSSIRGGRVANAWVSYNSTTKNLSVFLTYADNPVYSGNSSLSYIVDLRDVLPEWVRIGFSASTGRQFEIHNILSWSFNSTLGTSGKRKNLEESERNGRNNSNGNSFKSADD